MNEEKKLGINELKQTITPSENKFKKALIRRLQAEMISGEIGHNQFLPCPAHINNVPRDLHRTLNKYLLYSGHQIFRPDFIFLKYGICIEIDGNIHELNEITSQRDLLKDLLLYKMGITNFRIPERDIYSEENLRKRLDEIVQYIKHLEAKPKKFKRLRNRVKKQVSKARKSVSSTLWAKLQYRPHYYPTLYVKRSCLKHGGYSYEI